MPQQQHTVQRAARADQFARFAITRLAGLAALVLGATIVVGCNDGPIVAPESVAIQPCTVSPSFDASAAGVWTHDDLIPVLADAADRSAPALGPGQPAEAVRIAMRGLASSWSRDQQSGCRALETAADALAALPADPVTDADRATIQVAIDLAAAVVGGPQN